MGFYCGAGEDLAEHKCPVDIFSEVPACRVGLRRPQAERSSSEEGVLIVIPVAPVLQIEISGLFH